jgi:hypothetical protein
VGNFTVIDAAQRSPEWYAARLGRLTASRAADADAKIKTGEAAARRNLRMQLVLERVTGRSQERNFQSQAMVDGIEREVDAVSAYEALTGRLLQTTGFLAHNSLLAGCSPDGYLDDFAGIVEIKSPLPATHLEYLRSGAIPGDYQKQIIHSLWITGAEWCDWLSYQPDFPEPLQTKLVRVWAKDVDLKAWQFVVQMFLNECDREYADVRGLMEVAAVA